MNTMTFIFGQLLTLEMVTAGRQPPRQPLRTQFQPPSQFHHSWKGFFMDNSILVIAFLIVSLLANFVMPTKGEEQ